MITKWLIGTVAVLGLVALSVGLTLVFTSPGIEEVSDREIALAAVGLSGDGGTSEGINVHGDWIIDVRDPDGSLVSSSEFKNALIGNEALAKLLNREASVGKWRVTISTPGSGLNVCEHQGSPNPCILVEPNDTLSNNLGHVFETLSVSRSNSSVIFSGNFTADRDGSVKFVSTTIGLDSAMLAFTQASLASPVEVVKGQQISVTVTISFSS